MPETDSWKPRTMLGRQVLAGEITSMQSVFENGLKIREPEVVDTLLPDIRNDIIMFGGSPGKGGGIRRTSTRRTARMHRSGRRFKISALAIVGSPGYLGVGKANATEHRVAVDKAIEAAKLNIIPVKRGCGSWECRCEEEHSIPMKAVGKSGSVSATLLPAPKGIGLCIGEEGKKMLRLARIRDIWTDIRGNTKTRYNYVFAIFNAFKNLNKSRVELKEEEETEGKEIKEMIKGVEKTEEKAEMPEESGQEIW